MKIESEKCIVFSRLSLNSFFSLKNDTKNRRKNIGIFCFVRKKRFIRLREAINIKLVKRNASLFIRYFLRDIFTARNITHRLSIRDLKRASQSHKTMLCARVRHRRKTHKFNSGMEQKKRNREI